MDAEPFERLPRGRHGLAPAQIAESQRRRLLEAAAAIFSERGYLGTTSRPIARRAGVSSSTFYAHFDGVPAIMRACFELTAELLLGVIDDTCDMRLGAEARVETALAAACGLAASRPRLLGLELAVVQKEVAAEREALTRRLAALLSESSARRQHPRLSAAIAQLLVAAALSTIAERTACGPGDADSQLGPELARLLCAGPL